MSKNNPGLKKRIKSIAKLVYDNSQKSQKERGFPVTAIIWSKEIDFVNIDINKKSKDGKGKNHTLHAESIIIENLKNQSIKDKTIKAIIVLPPCNICLKKMEKISVFWDVFYLTDRLANKMDKEYIKKSKIPIKKLENEKHYDYLTKLYINYLIYKVTKVASMHNNSEDKVDMIEDERASQMASVLLLIHKIKAKDEFDMNLINYFKKEIRQM